MTAGERTEQEKADDALQAARPNGDAALIMNYLGTGGRFLELDVKDGGYTMAFALLLGDEDADEIAGSPDEATEHCRQILESNTNPLQKAGRAFMLRAQPLRRLGQHDANKRGTVPLKMAGAGAEQEGYRVLVAEGRSDLLSADEGVYGFRLNMKSPAGNEIKCGLALVPKQEPDEDWTPRHMLYQAGIPTTGIDYNVRLVDTAGDLGRALEARRTKAVGLLLNDEPVWGPGVANGYYFSDDECAGMVQRLNRAADGTNPEDIHRFSLFEDHADGAATWVGYVEGSYRWDAERHLVLADLVVVDPVLAEKMEKVHKNRRRYFGISPVLTFGLDGVKAVNVDLLNLSVVAYPAGGEKLMLDVSRIKESVEPGKYKIVLVQEGMSNNGYLWTRDLMERERNRFDKVRIAAWELLPRYHDHLPDSVYAKIGGWAFARNTIGYVEAPTVEQVDGKWCLTGLGVITDQDMNAKMALAPWQYGFSVDIAEYVSRRAVHGGQMANMVTSLGAVNELTLVSSPSAGGRVLSRLAASAGMCGAAQEDGRRLARMKDVLLKVLRRMFGRVLAEGDDLKAAATKLMAHYGMSSVKTLEEVFEQASERFKADTAPAEVDVEAYIKDKFAAFPAAVVTMGVCPDNPASYKISENKEWSAPTLGDLTDKPFADLPSAERGKIAAKFAWARVNPPEKFEDLKLPHHEADGNVNAKGVSTAMGALEGARSGVDIPEADIAKVKAHLKAHADEIAEAKEKAAKTESERLAALEQSMKKLKEENEAMKKEDFKAKRDARLRESKLPTVVQEKVQKTFTGDDLHALDVVIDAEKELLSRLTESGNIHIPGGSRVEVTAWQDRMQAGMDRMFGVAVTDSNKRLMESGFRFRGIREAYVAFTGGLDPEVVGQYTGAPQRLTEATTSDFSYALGTSMTRRLVQEYGAVKPAWQKICTIADGVDNFKLQERIRWGGFGQLNTVSESDSTDYPTLGFPSDERATYTPFTKGGKILITRRMIKNDDLRLLQQIPVRAAKAAHETLNRFVFDLMLNFSSTINGGTIYDSLALYHALHRNIQSTAFDYDQFVLLWNKLAQQWEYGGYTTINHEAGYAAGDTSIVVADASKFEAGDYGEFREAGQSNCEIVYVSAVNTDTNTLTVTRAQFGTTAAAIVHGEQVRVLCGQLPFEKPPILVFPFELRAEVIPIHDTENIPGVSTFGKNPYLNAFEMLQSPHLRGDVDNFFLVADPSERPGIEVAFIDNQREPMILLQDQPTVGNVFLRDVNTYKVRHEYGGCVVDFKAFAAGIV